MALVRAEVDDLNNSDQAQRLGLHFEVEFNGD